MNESSAQAEPRSDAELIAAVASGDEQAYSLLRERHEAAARKLAGLLSSDPAEAEEIVSETFSRLHDVLRDGGGPTAALRPYLLTAVRWAAYGRRSGQAGATTQLSDGDHHEPLFTDPAIADLVRAPLSRAFMSLPEPWRAVLWHTAIEPDDLAQTAALLGVAPDGLAEAAARASAALRQAYLGLYLPGVTSDDCRSALGALGTSADGALSGRDQPAAQQHLRGCAGCQAVANDLGDLGRPLRRVVAPIFLGVAAESYLAPAETRIGGLRWTRQQGTSQTGRAFRPQHVLPAASVLLLAFAGTGLALTLTATSAPQASGASQPPAATASHSPRPSSPAATVPPASPRPRHSKTATSTSGLGGSSGSGTPGSPPAPGRTTPPAPPRPTSPAPNPSPTVPPVIPTPTPSPTPCRHHRRRCPP